MILNFLSTYRSRIGLFSLAFFVATFGIYLYKTGWRLPNKILSSSDEKIEVSLPTIINGELVLPKVTTDSSLPQNALANQPRIGVVSANLIAIAGQDQQITGIRILGEMVGLGTKVVTEVSPVIRFFDANGAVLGQKIGHYSSGWNFFGLGNGEKSVYDVTVDNPPQADKLEIVLNAATASDSAIFDQLKIASRSLEVKTANYQGEATDSASESVEYYSVSGAVVNTLTDPISEISIYAWGRDKEGKVFAFSRQDFKNDLLIAGDKIDFKITLLPLKSNEVYDSYEVAAWGKRYQLNL